MFLFFRDEGMEPLNLLLDKFLHEELEKFSFQCIDFKARDAFVGT